MSEPFLAEIRLVGFNFAPRGWAFCDGQILPINQNQALFSLLGTTYGGDGRTTFALPDLRGRSPVHPGSGVTLGQRSGEETHSLTPAEVPAHDHDVLAATTNANANAPAGNVLARSGQAHYRSTPDALVGMAAGTIGNAGGSQAHENMQPYLTLSFCIALQGLFPSRN